MIALPAPTRLLALTLLALGLMVVPSARAATITVNTTADDDYGLTLCSSTGPCTIRQALQTALASPSDDEIVIPGGDYRLTLRRDDIGGRGGALSYLDNAKTAGALTITGAGAYGAGATTIRGGAPGLDTGILDIVPGTGAVTVRNLRLVDGIDNVADTSVNYGGGLRARGVGTADLTIEHVVAQHNTSASGGGGIGILGYGGALHIRDVELVDNTTTTGSTFMGGGMMVNGPGTLDAQRLSVHGNHAYQGGGMSAEMHGTVVDSVFQGNTSNNAGAGISVRSAAVRFTNITMADNVANLGPGAFWIVDSSTAEIGNSLLVRNGSNVCDTGTGADTLTSLGHNRLDATNFCTFAGAGDVTTGALAGDAVPAANGFPLYVPIASDDPAVNAGDSTYCVAGDKDVRGGRRTVGSACDIGAMEYGAVADYGVSASADYSSREVGKPVQFTAMVSLSGTEPAAGSNGATVVYEVPSGATVTGTFDPTGPCVARSASVYACPAGHVQPGPSGMSMTMITVTPSQVGPLDVTMRIEGDELDPVASNQTSVAHSDIVAPYVPPTDTTTKDTTTQDTTPADPHNVPARLVVTHAAKVLARGGVFKLIERCPLGVDGGFCSARTTIVTTARVRVGTKLRTVAATCQKALITSGTSRVITCVIPRVTVRALRTRVFPMRFTATSTAAGGGPTFITRGLLRLRLT